MKHFNRLSPAEAERLALLSEELGEVQHAIGKILRHGYESKDPTKSLASATNRVMLVNELGDLKFAIWLLCDSGDVSDSAIHFQLSRKAKNIGKYLHHQDYPVNGHAPLPPPPDTGASE